MGCVAGKLDINDVHPDMFTVLNVDEMGSKVSPGQIKITDSHLVLFQKGKSPVSWPFKSLRRYGFESEMFSFESGRRCPTGPGIYAFKCRRAEILFNLLQSKIRAGDNLERGDGGSPSDDSSTPRHGTGLPTSVTRESFSEPMDTSGVHSLQGEDQQLAQQKPPQPCLYVNCDLPDPPPSSGLPPLTLGGAARVPPLHPDLASPDTPSHQYENVTPGDPSSPTYKYSNPLLPSSPLYKYNPTPLLPFSPLQPSTSPLASPPQSPTSPGAVSLEFSGPTLPLNYILLDLDSTQSDNQTNGSKRPGVGYTTIDFDKTSALIKSANQRYEDDEPGIRKTRHNSSISDLSAAFKSPLSPTE